MSSCPCGSAKTYISCCGLYIEKKEVPQTPEQLMRSRYTAYSLAKTDYIKNTMKDKALIGFDESAAQQWAKHVSWLGLEVIRAEPAASDTGFVEFAARFLERDQVNVIHEISEFHRENGFWFYVSGVTQPVNKPPLARNKPCPCGSGKKFKNCHAK